MDGTIHVWLVGHTECPELIELQELLNSQADLSVLRLSPLEMRTRTGALDAIPALIVCFVAWPQQFSGRSVQRLLAEYPLCRVVACLGAWCESIGRNGSPWPISTRVPMRSAFHRIVAELEVLRGTRVALPTTASREEAFEFDHVFRWREDTPATVPVSIGILSDDHLWARTMERLLIEAGFTVDSEHPAVVLIDLNSCSVESRNQCRFARKRWPAARLFGTSVWGSAADPRLAEELELEAIIARLAPLSEFKQVISRRILVRN